MEPITSKDTKPLRDPDKSNCYTCCKLCELHPDQKGICKIFPTKKLVYAFNTARENIHLAFLTSEEAEEVYHNWKPECLGQASQARRVSSIEPPNKAVLRHGVPIDIEETEIEQMLSSNYAGIKAIRFFEKGGSALPTIKLIFPTTT